MNEWREKREREFRVNKILNNKILKYEEYK